MSRLDAFDTEIVIGPDHRSVHCQYRIDEVIRFGFSQNVMTERPVRGISDKPDREGIMDIHGISHNFQCAVGHVGKCHDLS